MLTYLPLFALAFVMISPRVLAVIAALRGGSRPLRGAVDEFDALLLRYAFKDAMTSRLAPVATRAKRARVILARLEARRLAAHVGAS